MTKPKKIPIPTFADLDIFLKHLDYLSLMDAEFVSNHAGTNAASVQKINRNQNSTQSGEI